MICMGTSKHRNLSRVLGRGYPRDVDQDLTRDVSSLHVIVLSASVGSDLTGTNHRMNCNETKLFGVSGGCMKIASPRMLHTWCEPLV